jgi:hypothetical protein
VSHHCHARGCSTPVPPERLFCLRHWQMVPRNLQAAVWRHYRDGQCDDKNPSRAWHETADAAIGFVALIEEQSCTRGEVRALIAYGYEDRVIEVWARRGEKYRRAAEQVIAQLKAETQSRR